MIFIFNNIFQTKTKMTTAYHNEKFFENDDGIYFKSGDYFDLKNKIDNFLEKKSRLINFSRLNRKFLERFLEKKNFEEYLRIFKNI